MGRWSALSSHCLHVLLLLVTLVPLASAPGDNLAPGGGGDELSVALKFTLDLSLSKSQEDAIVRPLSVPHLKPFP